MVFFSWGTFDQALDSIEWRPGEPFNGDIASRPCLDNFDAFEAKFTCNVHLWRAF